MVHDLKGYFIDIHEFYSNINKRRNWPKQNDENDVSFEKNKPNSSSQNHSSFFKSLDEVNYIVNTYLVELNKWFGLADDLTHR